MACAAQIEVAGCTDSQACNSSTRSQRTRITLAPTLMKTTSIALGHDRRERHRQRGLVTRRSSCTGLDGMRNFNTARNGRG